MTNMNQNGRSMIEMLGVLAIIGVLSVGGIAGYSKAMLKFRTNKTLDQISMVVTNIRTLYAQQRNFNGLDNTSALNMGVIPDEMQKNGGIYNAFNGAVNIKQSNSTAAADGTGRAFIVSFNNLPKQACVEMAVNDWGSNYSSGLIGMAIATESDQAATGTTAAKFSADVSGAYVGCGTSGQTGSTYSKTTGEGDNATTEYANSNDENFDSTGWTKTSSDSLMVCAAAMPLKVSAAASACNCEGNECSISFKYY